MNWYLKVLKQYADFEGRARRKEYWMYYLFNTIILVALMLVMMAGTISKNNWLSLIGKILYYGYIIVVFIPSVAVCVRRLHDIGKSGWYYFIGLIPLVGQVILIIWFCKDSQEGENEYDINPKEGDLSENNDSTNDSLILLVVAWIFVSQLFWLLMRQFDKFYLTEWFRFVNIFTSYIGALIPIALAFTVKDKTKQIIIFILAGIYFLYSLTQIINTFISMQAMSSFIK